MKTISAFAIIVLLAAAAAAPAADETAAPPERIAKLVADLGADSYIVRQDATEELIRIGKPAIAALEQAVESSDAEVRMRATKALAEIRKSDFERASDAVAKRMVWKTPIAGGVSGSPAVVGGRLAVACWDDKVRLLDAKTGKLAGEIDAESRTGAAADGRRIFVKDADGKLAAISAETVKPVEGFTGPAIEGAPAAGDGIIYVAGANKTFLALAAGTGKAKWTVTLPDPAVGEVVPAVGEGLVCVVTGEGVVRALSAADGKEKWSSDPVAGAKFVAVAGGKVLVSGQDAVTAFDADGGKRAWSYAKAPAAGAAGGMQVRVVQQIVVNGRKLPPPGADNASLALTVADGVTYLTAGDKLVALTADGKEKWSMTTSTPAEEKKDAQPGGGIAIGGGQIMVAGGGNAQVRIFVAGNAGGANIVGRSGGPAGLTGATVHGGVAYVGGPDGLHAVDLASHVELWKLPTPAPVAGRPVIADGVIYFGTFRPGQLVKGVAAEEDGPTVYAVKVE